MPDHFGLATRPAQRIVSVKARVLSVGAEQQFIGVQHFLVNT